MSLANSVTYLYNCRFYKNFINLLSKRVAELMGANFGHKVNALTDNEVSKNVLTMLGIALLSILFGELKFDIPGLLGVFSDLRTLVVFIGVLYVTKWYYLIGVSFLTAITTPAEGFYLATALGHLVSSIFIFLVYTKLLVKIKSNLLQSFSWAVVIVIAYLVFALPIIVILYQVMGMAEARDIIGAYGSILSATRFEVIVTAIISSLFYFSYQMRQKLVVNSEELFFAKEKAEESDALKTSFLQNISHEIRTPLNTISGGAHLVVQGDMNEEDSKIIKQNMTQSVDYMIELIDQVLDFSKLETGVYDKDFTTFSISSLRKSILDTPEIQKKTEELKDVCFKTQLSDSLGNKKLHSNEELVQMIIVLIIRNAFKFTNKGDVTLAFHSYEEDQLLIEISDTGIGIAEDKIPKVFDRFYQVDHFQKGVGLGLSFVSRMVDYLDGSIKLESELKVGTKVEVILPGLS